MHCTHKIQVKRNVSVFKNSFKREKNIWIAKNLHNLEVISSSNYSFLNLASMQKLIIIKDKDSNCISHLVYYFILNHMHLVIVNFARDSLTPTLMPPTLMPYCFEYGDIYLLVLLGFLIYPCNELLVGDSHTRRS